MSTDQGPPPSAGGASNPACRAENFGSNKRLQYKNEKGEVFEDHLETDDCDQSSRKVKDKTDILVRFTVTPSSPTEPNEGSYSRKIGEAPPSPTTKQDKTKTTSRGSSGSHYLPRTSSMEPAACCAYSRCHLSLPLTLLIC